MLYTSKILVDSPKGANTRVVAEESSKKLSDHFFLLDSNSFEIIRDEWLPDYVLDAMQDIKAEEQKKGIKGLYYQYAMTFDELTTLKAAAEELDNEYSPLSQELNDLIEQKVNSLMLSDNGYDDLKLEILGKIAGYNIGFEFEAETEDN